VSELSNIRHVVLDMDGTMYLGRELFPHTRPFLATLERLGIGCSFITNNCLRSRAEYASHLREIGIDVRAESIWTSAHATIHYLRKHLPYAERLFVLGTSGLDDEFHQVGFRIVDERPDTVIVGFDLALSYNDLAQTAYWISTGLPYVATHPDRVCPTDRRIVLPDCGAICALLESATGRRPDAVPGKPNPEMLRAVFEQHDLPSDAVAMIGDRLYTDVRMARDAGALAVLTLTGETRQPLVDACPESDKPDLIVRNLEEFGRFLQDARS
jgi:NagD protein